MAFGLTAPAVAEENRDVPEESEQAVIQLVEPGRQPGGATNPETGDTQAYGVDLDASRQPLQYSFGSIRRLQGSDRFGTAVAVSKELRAGTSETVILANGRNFPDALSAAPAAANVGAPILLAEADSLPAVTRDELTRLAPKQVVLLGGDSALSQEVATAAQNASPKARIVRVSGANRYATSAAISKSFWPAAGETGISDVLVASGEDFPDALAGAGAAAKLDVPLLLMGRDGISPEVAIELYRLHPQHVHVLGRGFSPQATASLQAVIRTYANPSTDMEIHIVGGANRYETAFAIADAFFGSRQASIVASGVSFPDSLVAAPLARAAGVPILLAPQSSCSPRGRVESYRVVSQRLFVGGEAAVPETGLNKVCSIADTTRSDSITVLVNKQHPLAPMNYVPPNLVSASDYGIPVSGANGMLRAEAAEAMLGMLAEARSAGAGFSLVSGYRSYSAQASLFASYARRSGAAQANRYSARPGYSEHQTGLAADVAADGAVLTRSFANTRSGQWLAANSWRFGFILRYPENGEPVTGYIFEPWHFRFIGTPAAAAYHQGGFSTYEAFLASNP